MNKPHRADRRWSKAWSPEQISYRLRIEFGVDESMRISHEAIYQALFIEGRGALKRELVTCLRTGRALRSPRERSRNKPQGHVTADVVIGERPAEAEDRAVPGHWEGDLWGCPQVVDTGRVMRLVPLCLIVQLVVVRRRPDSGSRAWSGVVAGCRRLRSIWRHLGGPRPGWPSTAGGSARV